MAGLAHDLHYLYAQEVRHQQRVGHVAGRRRRGLMAHTCHATGCKVAVPPEMFMCKRHWFSLPKSMRDRIWATYRPGQCDDWKISHAYAEAARAAVRYIATREGREADVRVYDMLDPEVGRRVAKPPDTLTPGNPTVISLDTETTGIDLYHGARPFFVTVCRADGEQTYWEWDVDPLTREPRIPEEDAREIRHLVGMAEVRILQNAKFDVTALRQADIMEWVWSGMGCTTHDTLIASHLLASNMPHDLTSLAMQYLGIDILPLEKALEVAVKEARRMVQQARLRRKKVGTLSTAKVGTLFDGMDVEEDGEAGPVSAVEPLADWFIAGEGLPGMPSAKEEAWKYDMWLPRALRVAGHADDKPEWDTVLSDYSNADSAVTIKLWQVMEPEIRRRGLWEVYLERIKLLPIVYGMERRGVTLNRNRAEELRVQYLEQSANHHETCIRLSGGEMDALPANGVSNALRHVVFDKFGLVPCRTTKKGNESMDKYVLDDWLATLPPGPPRDFISNLKAYRKRKTALSFIYAYQKYWLEMGGHGGNGDGVGDGVVLLHGNINPTATDTLRFGMANPNLQQVSKQEIAEEEQHGLGGHTARYMFGPAPSREWWALDYENIELRIPAYEAGEDAMIALFERPDDPPYYGSNHLLFFDILHHDKFTEEVCVKCLRSGNSAGGCVGSCGERRPLWAIKGGVKAKYGHTWYQWTKNGDFAVQYGAVASSGTADRAYHVPGAQVQIESRLTKIKALSNRMIAYAEKRGYVETIPDRTVNPHHGYPLLCTRTPNGRIMPTVPLSYHVQGTAMQCTTKAMVRCDAQLSEWRSTGFDAHMVLQVHDEIVFDMPAGGKRNLPRVRRLKQLMEQSGDDIGVPLKVSISYHPRTWGEAEKL